MNRLFALTGIALSAVVTLTGCGGTKKAATVAQSATAKARHHSPGAATTVPGTVRVGAYCATIGAAGRTTSGALAHCQKRPGDTRARWYTQSPLHGARAGEYCSPAGATATSSTGKKLTCTKERGDTRPRWHAK